MVTSILSTFSARNQNICDGFSILDNEKLCNNKVKMLVNFFNRKKNTDQPPVTCDNTDPSKNYCNVSNVIKSARNSGIIRSEVPVTLPSNIRGNVTNTQKKENTTPEAEEIVDENLNRIVPVTYYPEPVAPKEIIDNVPFADHEAITYYYEYKVRSMLEALEKSTKDEENGNDDSAIVTPITSIDNDLLEGAKSIATRSATNYAIGTATSYGLSMAKTGVSALSSLVKMTGPLIGKSLTVVQNNPKVASGVLLTVAGIAAMKYAFSTKKNDAAPVSGGRKRLSGGTSEMPEQLGFTIEDVLMEIVIRTPDIIINTLSLREAIHNYLGTPKPGLIIQVDITNQYLRSNATRMKALAKMIEWLRNMNTILGRENKLSSEDRSLYEMTISSLTNKHRTAKVDIEQFTSGVSNASSSSEKKWMSKLPLCNNYDKTYLTFTKQYANLEQIVNNPNNRDNAELQRYVNDIRNDLNNYKSVIKYGKTFRICAKKNVLPLQLDLQNKITYVMNQIMFGVKKTDTGVAYSGGTKQLSEKTKYKGRMRKVYTGIRGGKYIKVDGKKIYLTNMSTVATSY